MTLMRGKHKIFSAAISRVANAASAFAQPFDRVAICARTRQLAVPVSEGKVFRQLSWIIQDFDGGAGMEIRRPANRHSPA